MLSELVYFLALKFTSLVDCKRGGAVIALVSPSSQLNFGVFGNLQMQTFFKKTLKKEGIGKILQCMINSDVNINIYNNSISFLSF